MKKNLENKTLPIVLGILIGIVVGFCAGISAVGVLASGALVGVIAGILMKEKTSGTGLGRVIGVLTFVVATIAYVTILTLVSKIVIVMALLYFAPYVIMAIKCLEIERDEYKKKQREEQQREQQQRYGEQQKNAEFYQVNRTSKETVSVSMDSTEIDPYFVDAGRFIIEYQKASIGNLQRMYKIGFNRAARLMDQLAAAGVVSEDNGTARRQIYMSRQEFEDYLAKNQTDN